VTLRGLAFAGISLCAITAAAGSTFAGSTPTGATLAGATAAGTPVLTSALPYPPSPASTASDTLHGVAVPDPYRWLENPKSPEVQRWESAEDSLARAVLGRLPARADLAARLHQLLYIDDVISPLHRGGRYFYKRRRADQEKAVLYWKEGRKGAERVLLDPNTWTSAGNASLGEWVP